MVFLFYHYKGENTLNPKTRKFLGYKRAQNLFFDQGSYVFSDHLSQWTQLVLWSFNSSVHTISKYH